VGDAPTAARAVATERRVPDFFIVGHPKCGTTALYAILRSHPQIFMPAVKEPRYFAPEPRSRAQGQVRENAPAPAIHPHRYSLDAYLDLFAAASPQEVAGEASPTYLRSRTAAASIVEVAPAARIVAILREPASFLRSMHLQNVHTQLEDEQDLGKALALEGERREGRRIPRSCPSPQALLYSEQVRYVEQLQRFYDVFPAENVLVVIYDDFRRDNDATARKIMRFLGVDDAAAIDDVETSTLKGVRSRRLHGLRRAIWTAQHNPASAGRGARLLNAAIPRGLRGDAGRSLWQRALYSEAAPPDDGLMLELRRRFRGEVAALGEHLDRDLLSLWGYEQGD
jgi:sulfotransferase family protein